MPDVPHPKPSYINVYTAATERYDGMPYRRCGRSGVMLPALSLGLWRNYGDNTRFDIIRAVLQHAFDNGITHFDFANNYGLPYGSAEENFGRLMAQDFKSYRDELIIGTKAGWEMWPGPYGNWGSRKHLLASLDQSLRRMRLDYVDIFYSHRPDPYTPIEETMGALDQAVRQGKAVYAGISMYNPGRTREAAQALKSLGTPLLVHQASYSMLNRWPEGGLLDELAQNGAGCIGFSPLAQGMLSDKYLDGIPPGSRATEKRSLPEFFLSDANMAKVRALNDIARRRGQTLSQMALAWALRDERVASVVIGVRDVAQLKDDLGALSRMDFSQDELAEIDRYATESDINLWAESLRE
jgi:L-glyceraldehyde 3-phosphate reductase